MGAARVLLWVSLTLLAVSAGADDNDDDGDRRAQSLVGTWLFTVEFGPGGPPPFQELATFHAGGTMTETNTTLNTNTATDPNALLPVNGSDGQGTWRRLSRDEFAFTFHKMVFCSQIPLPTPVGQCANNALFGYLRVDGRVRVNGNRAVQSGADSRTVLLAPNLRDLIFDFGGADSQAVRLR